MRSSRILTVTLVVALSLAVPSAFANICHPKKPITCSTADLSRPAVVTVSSPATKSAVKTHSPAPTKQAFICGPWVRWNCAANTLTQVAVETYSPAPTQQAFICGPWVRWNCAANTLTNAAVKTQAPVPVKQAFICGPWVRWNCAANTLS